MALSITTATAVRISRLAGYVICFLLVLCAATANAQKQTAASARDYIQIRIYHAVDSVQLAKIDQYLQASLLPALEKNGFKKTGVFTAINNDTATDKRVYVLVSFPSLTELERITTITDKTIIDSVVSPGYTKALYNAAPYSRMETILLKSFETAPQVKPSAVKGALNERLYELRSYESATEAIHQNKVQMFSSGEVDLFQRLGFNAVFYAQVIAGSRMPNLMYMTSFESKTARDEHWKAFSGDPAWKAMSSLSMYKSNVSKIDIVFLRPTAYSKL